ncbi:MAG: FecR domain-containing protein [Candidatus Solibacter sp.]
MLAWKAACWFLVLSSSLLSLQGAETVIGSVKTAEGGATVHRGSETIPAREGFHLLLNDTLQTPAGGRLGAILQDGTRISLGPNTELKIDQFVYDPAAGKFGLLLRLGRGVMAYISGKIAQFSPGSATVETPVGVLGLRGTHIAVSLEGMQ